MTEYQLHGIRMCRKDDPHRGFCRPTGGTGKVAVLNDGNRRPLRAPAMIRRREGGVQIGGR
jgi:hypothetical protein